MGLRNLFGRRRPPAQAAAPQQADNGVYLYNKVKGERRWYRCAETGQALLVKDAPNSYGLAFSLDEDEVRLPTTTRLSYHESFRRLRQERGIHASLINRSKDLSAVYGIDELTAHAFPGKTIPLLLLVDKIVRAKVQAESIQGPVVALILFGAAGHPNLNALVVGYNEDNSVAIGTLASNIVDLAPVLSNAIRVMTNANSLRGLPFSPAMVANNPDQKRLEAEFIRTNTVRIEFTDLLDAAANELGYPRAQVFRGVAVQSIGRIALMTSAVAAAAGWLGFFLLVQQVKQVQKETLAITAAKEAKQAELKEKLLARVDGLSRKLTLDPTGLFDAAAVVWHPGTKVQLDANLAKADMSLVIPNVRGNLAPGMDRRLAPSSASDTAMLEALRTPPPPGWTLNGIETSGDLNAFHVAFATHPVDGGLLDIVGYGAAPKPPEMVSAAATKPATPGGPSLLGRK